MVINKKMTLLGKLFMAGFFFASGAAFGFYYGNGKSFKPSGIVNNTEINIKSLKPKDGSSIDLTYPVTNKGEQTRKKKKRNKR